jgi:hypothetical protein
MDPSSVFAVVMASISVVSFCLAFRLKSSRSTPSAGLKNADRVLKAAYLPEWTERVRGGPPAYLMSLNSECEQFEHIVTSQFEENCPECKEPMRCIDLVSEDDLNSGSVDAMIQRINERQRGQHGS